MIKKEKPLYNSLTPPKLKDGFDNNKEYESLLKELYKENQAFLNKAIFTVSTLAIPFLFKTITDQSSILLSISMIGFCGVILLQISSLRDARDGCDKSLLEDSRQEGEELFIKARTKDIYRERLFAFSLILTAISLILKTF
jgi:hypothetical protein